MNQRDVRFQISRAFNAGAVLQEQATHGDINDAEYARNKKDVLDDVLAEIEKVVQAEAKP